MPFSLRLDPDTEARIRRLSAATGQSKAQVVREAIASYNPEANGVTARAPSAFDRVQPYIGLVRTGGASYSIDTHAKYRALLQRKHRARRAR